MGPSTKIFCKTHQSRFPSREATEISASLSTIPLLSSLPFPSLAPLSCPPKSDDCSSNWAREKSRSDQDGADLSRSGPSRSTASSTRSGHPRAGGAAPRAEAAGAAPGTSSGGRWREPRWRRCWRPRARLRAPLRSGRGRRRRPAVHLPLGQSSAFNANLAGRALAKEVDVIHALVEVGSDTDGFARASAMDAHQAREARHIQQVVMVRLTLSTVRFFYTTASALREH
ncbi:hypothetical protein PVAP13_1KG250600 [Panicum virgatum]|uniref:Uncharacterized protein n=1 Tax=Panicum virgatum TaxID=38727 RepID=A0A8T0X9M9_PANVG|nr:hypothetical protein PVAP13_1KG250600 [Panicum virgatum]KAG2658274.1 hypothetical protein PVAP13_1KG250600 [Panicum virgatum]KAG2658275.1 hypothetical protein PVAP13_1KG250600 [Panicum virgatum]KAG2658276.1 hypothetical protein PVAP13_1KG250600 [Panicum virgatum]KAG2658277.1 hypothetical protein PVAP13_1KG250600 [Panicum virgatum]